MRDYEKQWQEAEDRVKRKLWQKMSRLMRHFKITDGDMGSLAWALAIEHVPGFKIVPENKAKRGRKKKWDGEKLQALFDAVQTVKTKHNFTDRQALKFIATNSEFKDTWGAPASHPGSFEQWIETLESRLQDAKGYIKHLEALQELVRPMKFRKI